MLKHMRVCFLESTSLHAEPERTSAFAPLSLQSRTGTNACNRTLTCTHTHTHTHAPDHRRRPDGMLRYVGTSSFAIKLLAHTCICIQCLLYTYTCVCIHVHAYTCVCIQCMCLCIHVRVHSRAYIHVHVCTCVYMCVGVHVLVHLHKSLCVVARVCVCVCARLCKTYNGGYRCCTLFMRAPCFAVDSEKWRGSSLLLHHL